MDNMDNVDNDDTGSKNLKILSYLLCEKQALSVRTIEQVCKLNQLETIMVNKFNERPRQPDTPRPSKRRRHSDFIW